MWIEILRKSRNTKKKREKLLGFLAKRGIPGDVKYKAGKGWMYQQNEKDLFPQLIGYEFYSAMTLIQSGTLDFLKGKK